MAFWAMGTRQHVASTWPGRRGRRKVRGPSELNLTKSDWYSTRPAPLQAGGGGFYLSAPRSPPTLLGGLGVCCLCVCGSVGLRGLWV